MMVVGVSLYVLACHAPNVWLASTTSACLSVTS